MKKLGLSLITLALLFSFAHAQEATQIHQYGFQIAGVKVGYGTYDTYTKIVAQFLKDKGLSADCIDLRRDLIPKEKPIKDDNGKTVPVVNMIRLLTNQKIDPTLFPELKSRICKGQSASCNIDGWGMSQNVNELQFFYRLESTDVLKSFDPGPERTTRFQTPDKFPVFSSSCKSGETPESIFNNARSVESRAMIKKAGLDIKKIAVIGLLTTRGESFWGFGKPDKAWTNHPTTEKNQELAPKDILNYLK